MGYASGIATLDAGASPAAFVGRERERRVLDGIVAGPGPRAAVVAGEPGIGRTALLEQVAGAARRALWVRGVESETVLAFAGGAPGRAVAGSGTHHPYGRSFGSASEPLGRSRSM